MSKVIAMDINTNRLNDANAMGATKVINVSEEKAMGKIEEYTNGKKLDYIFDSSGHIKALESSLSLINNKGLVKFASHPKYGELLRIDPFELILGKRIEGSWGGGVKPELHFESIALVASKNKTFIELYNSKRYSLDDINEAISDMKNGKIMRPIIDFESKGSKGRIINPETPQV